MCMRELRGNSHVRLGANEAQQNRQEDEAVREAHDCGREKLLEQHLSTGGIRGGGRGGEEENGSMLHEVKSHSRKYTKLTQKLEVALPRPVYRASTNY